MIRPLLVAATLAAVALAPAAASAAPKDDVAKARALGGEAADLLDQKRYAEALERVTQAESLYHAPTHLLMMAQSQEGLGKLTLAMATYERLATEPLPKAAPDAFVRAQETGKKRLNALLARVPSVLVTVRGEGAAAAKGTIDGMPIDLASTTATRLDPGAHTFRAEAPGSKAVERQVTLPEKGGVTTVELALERDATAAPAAPIDPNPKPPERAAPSGQDAPAKPSRAPAVVAFGLGAVGLGVGAVTGILSLGKVSALRARCTNNHCVAADQPDIDSAGMLGTVSTIGFGVGAAGLVAGVVLLLTSGPPKAPAAASGTALSPWIGPASAGIRGAF